LYQTQGKVKFTQAEIMHVNQSLLRQAVFKEAAYRLDVSVKTSSPLPDCRVNDSL